MKKEMKIFDNPRNVKLTLYGFYASLVVLLLLDIFIHRHTYFSFEKEFGFFAVYGFISCVGLIFIAKIMRVFLKRNEDHYDPK
jgi:hypothetical protein